MSSESLKRKLQGLSEIKEVIKNLTYGSKNIKVVNILFI
jgi:hypothetical protein